MSKENALRAMREARYAEAQKRAGQAPARRVAPVAPPAEKTVAARSKATGKAAASPAVETEDALCGHRNISGRTCTRESGHPQKSHRYS